MYYCTHICTILDSLIQRYRSDTWELRLPFLVSINLRVGFNIVASCNINWMWSKRIRRNIPHVSLYWCTTILAWQLEAQCDYVWQHRTPWVWPLKVPASMMKVTIIFETSCCTGDSIVPKLHHPIIKAHPQAGMKIVTHRNFGCFQILRSGKREWSEVRANKRLRPDCRPQIEI